MIQMNKWKVDVVRINVGHFFDNGIRILEFTSDLSSDWILKLDIRKNDNSNVIDLNRVGNIYSVILTDDILCWTGDATAQIRGINGDLRGHTNSFIIEVDASIGAIDHFPTIQPSEMEQLETRLTALKTESETAKTEAQSARDAAESAKTNAETAQTAAETARTGAQTAEMNAGTYATNAENSATAADSARDAAVTAKTEAETARDAAVLAKTAAETAETNAETAESNAQTYATNAENSATAALAAQSAAEEAAQTAAAHDIVLQTGLTAVQQLAARSNIDAQKQAYETTAGYIATCTDANAGTCYPTIYGNSVQDGTPAPDAPVAIESVTSPVELAVAGKNLWNLTDQNLHFMTGASDNNISPSGSISTGVFNLLPIGQQITLACDFTRYVDDNVTYPRITIRFNYTDGTNDVNQGFNNQIPADGNTRRIFVTCYPKKEISNIQFWLADYSSQTFRHFQVTNIQLELGTIATPFAPYTGTDYSIPLLASDREKYPEPLELRSTPVASDILMFDKMIKNTETYTVPHSNLPFVYTPANPGAPEYTAGYCVFFRAPPIHAMIGQQTSRCTHLPNVDYAWSPTVLQECYSDHSTSSAKFYKILSSRLGVTDDASDADKVAAFVAWWTANNVKVVYTRATPLEIALSDETQAILHSITTLEGTNNIMVNGSTVQPWLSVKYRQDLQKYVKDKLAAIQAAIISLGGNI